MSDENAPAVPAKPRKKGVLRIELPPAAKSLADVLGQTSEQFVADALAKHIDAVRADINAKLGK